MGEVYRARDTRLGREVAIKVLPAERLSDEHRRARFVQEARAASALNHPHIVTIHEIESAEGTDFIVMELGPDGVEMGTARRVTRKAIMPLGLAWTRDGKSLVYCDWTRLWRVSLQGDEAPRQIEIAGFNALSPAIAASRNRLAFVRRGTTLAVYRFEPGRPAVAVVVSSFNDWSPHLSPDGSRISFASSRGDGGNDEIWLAAADGSNPTQLTRGPGVNQGSPRWSPDGGRIAFDSLDEDGHSDIWTIDAEGGGLRRLTSSPVPHYWPTWSHDGRFVYFNRGSSGALTIWRVPAGGGPEEQVAHTGGGAVRRRPTARRSTSSAPAGSWRCRSLAARSERSSIA
jgi:Tol biopolymer transport system component